MPRIEEAPERQPISGQLFQTPSREPLKQQPQLVMYARGGVARGGGNNGEPWSSLSQLFKYGSGLMFAKAEKQNDEDYIRGKTSQMQGKTLEELEKNGESAWTMYGYKTMQAATFVNAWYGQELSEIEKSNKEVDPNFYREHLIEKFNQMLGDDPQANRLITQVAEKYMPDLTARQIKAHSAWAHGQALQAYQDNLIALSANGGDVQSVMKSDPSIFNISKEEQQEINAKAAVYEMESKGTTTIYGIMTGLTGGAVTPNGQLGGLSAKYESSGRSSTVGHMSRDGRAFGRFQLSEKQGTADAFVDYLSSRDPQAAAMLRDPATREQNWNQLVAEGRVQEYEYSFMLDTHYKPALDQLKPELKEWVNSSRPLQEALFSTAVQHGAAANSAGAGSIFNKVYRKGMTEEEFITALYDERKTRFPSSTPGERKNVQARLEKEKLDAVAMTGMRNLSPAALSSMSAAYRKLQTKSAVEFSQSESLFADRLTLAVQSGDMTEEEAIAQWEQHQKLSMSDPRYSMDGVADDLARVDISFRRAMIPAKAKAKEKASKEYKINMAVLHDDVADLTKPEQMAAWDKWKQGISTEVQMKIANGMPAEQAQEWGNNQFLLQAKKWSMAVDKRTANDWSTAILNPFDSKGVVTQEAANALDMWSTLHSMSPAVAEAYMTNDDAASIMYTAAELYKVVPSAQEALLEAKNLHAEGKTAKSLSAYVKSDEMKSALEDRVTEVLDDLDPGFWTDIFGGSASKSWEVWDTEIQNAVQSPEFRRRVQMQAGLVKRNSPGMPPEAVAKRAVGQMLNRAEFVLGNMLVQDTPASIKQDMGLTGYQDPLTVNNAVLEYLRANGKTMFGNDWNPGTVLDAGYWRGVPPIQVRYNSADKLFYFKSMSDPDTGEYGSITFPVRAEQIGKWYNEQNAAELSIKRKRAEYFDNQMRMMVNPFTVADSGDPMDFSDKYNTRLTDKEEEAYQKWAKETGRENDTYDYDLRGAWKELQSGSMSEDDRGHLGDKYKKPNHPTFSKESKYSGTDGYEGGEWIESDGKFSFRVGRSNTWSKERLRNYFSESEPDVKLIDRR